MSRHRRIVLDEILRRFRFGIAIQVGGNDDAVRRRAGHFQKFHRGIDAFGAKHLNAQIQLFGLAGDLGTGAGIGRHVDEIRFELFDLGQDRIELFFHHGKFIPGHHFGALGFHVLGKRIRQCRAKIVVHV